MFGFKNWLIAVIIFFAGMQACWPVAPVASPRQYDFNNVNLRDVLRILAKWTKRSIVLSPAIVGSVNMHLQHVSAMEVFDLLLNAYNLKATRVGNIWYVGPAENLIKQQQEELKWRDTVEDAAPLLTHIWPIHYAKAEDIAHWLQQGHDSLLSKRGQLHVDARTNVLGVQDTDDRVKMICNLIKQLDVPVKQVVIEARLVSIDSDYEQELGIRFATISGLSDESDQKKAFQGSKGQFSLVVATLADNSLLDVKLSALENQGHAELISSPSLYTASQQTASIEAGEEIPYQEASASGATAVVFKKAVLSLKVTPQVLPGKKVLLQLQLNQDRPSVRMVLGVPSISTRQMKTNVLIAHGHTVVLGGIYESNKENNQEGLPFLSKIPVLGWLFQVNNHRRGKREMLVFVTPRIIE